jgi:gas vesicle protein
MSTGKVLLGLLAGIAAGATLGILFAPDKGSTTRRKITQKGEDYVEELEDKFNDVVNGLSRRFEAMKGEVTHMAENGKAKMDHAMVEVAAAAKGNNVR